MTAAPSQRDPVRRFSDRVEYYVRSRPKYPLALLQFCRESLGLRAEDCVADIGSGTGFLSELFVRNGNTVYAVEPNAPMRAAAEDLLGKSPNFHSSDGTAEATGLDSASVDFITAGQAFHWFDRSRCRQEFARILRPGGWVLIAWNERKIDIDDFAKAYEKIVNEFQTDLDRVRHQHISATDSKTMADFFAPATYAVTSFPNPQFLDLDGFLARAMSSSYLPLPGQPRFQEMLDRLRDLFSTYAHDGKILQDYDTRVFYGHLS